MRGVLIAFCLASVIALTGAGHAFAARRAFIAGISNYKLDELKLITPSKDAGEVARILSTPSFGFGSVKPIDEKKLKTQAAFYDAWKSFLDGIKPGDDVFVYFSGHGVSRENQNYLFPGDVNPYWLENTDPTHVLVAVDELKRRLLAKGPGVVVWVLDACRDIDKDLQPMKGRESQDTNQAFLYSAPFGKVSFSVISGSNFSLYTHFLSYFMKNEPKEDIRDNGIDAGTNSAALYNRRYQEWRVGHPDAPDDHRVQAPPIFGGLGDYWCLGVCRKQPIAVAMDTGTSAVVTKGKLAFANTSKVTHKDRQQNAIFIGRRRSASDCHQSRHASHPFGCEILQQVVAGQTRSVIGQNLSTTIDTNIRKRAPIIRRAHADKYACPVDVLREGQSVQLTGVIEIRYQDDAFFWGTVRRGNNCLPDSH